MYFKQIPTLGLGCLSYVIGCPVAGVMCVVDPKRDIAEYLAIAQKNKMRITHIFDTHVHADHISGGLELSAATGADIYLHENAPLGYKFTKVKHGDCFEFGKVVIKALHSPGHTPNSISYLVADRARTDEPLMLLSGDLLFVGDIGRPDLPGEEILDEQVINLHDSLFKLLADLPDGLEIYPAHGQGSLCGSNLSAKPVTTLGYERKANPRLQLKDFAAFKKNILTDLPMRPQSFSHIISTNIKGTALIDPKVLNGRALPVAEFAKLKADGAAIIDMRDYLAFCGGHIPGSISIDPAVLVSKWIGTIVEPNSKIVLVLDDPQDYKRLVWDFLYIGYDNVLGWLDGGVQAWIEAGHCIQTMQLISNCDLKQSLKSANPPKIFDVRTKKEFNESHLEEAAFLHMDALLEDGKCPVNKDEELVLMCQSGSRSFIVASLLLAKGCTKVKALAGGLDSLR